MTHVWSLPQCVKRLMFCGNHKIRERKVKTLTRNWRDHCRTGTRKHTETVLTGTAVFINQKRANVCEHTTKMASLESLWKVPPGGCERNGWREIIWPLFCDICTLVLSFPRVLWQSSDMSQVDVAPFSPYFATYLFISRWSLNSVNITWKKKVSIDLSKILLIKIMLQGRK